MILFWHICSDCEVYQNANVQEEKASEKDAVASALSEHRKILSDSTENCKTPQEPNTSMRPSLKLQGNILTGTNVFSLFSKAPPVRHSNWPLALLFRVVVIAVLFIIFASIWRCLKFWFYLDIRTFYSCFWNWEGAFKAKSFLYI